MPSLVNTTFPGAACVAAATIRLGRDGPDQAASPTVAVTRFPSRRRARSIVAALSIPRSGSIFPSSPLPTSFFRSLTVVLRSPSWSVPREPAPSEATRSGPPEFDASLSTPQTPCGWTLEVSARGQGWRPSPGERSVDAYRLEASDDDGVTWTELADYTGDRTSLRYTMHRGLEPDTTYSYRITPIIGGGAGGTSSVVRATTRAAASVIDGLTWDGVLSGRRGTGANLCWTPDGAALSELSAFQYGRMEFELDEHSAMPFENDGTFEFRAIGRAKSCNGGAGTGMFIRALSGLEYFVKFRAMRDGRWVESNTVTVQVHDRGTPLKSQIQAQGFYGIGPDAEPVFADVPGTVTEPFQIAVGFGYHLPFDASLTEVTGFALSDLTATNATLSAPTGGFAFEQFIGYRVVVTPTTYGTDVMVQVKASAVTGTGTSKTNRASNTFRRKTAQAQQASALEPALSVADAEATEGEEDTLAFTVTLNPASSGRVTEVEGRLASLYPYARFRVSERTDVWGLVGYGTGELRLVEPARGARVHDVVTETELGMRMLALGARGAVLPADEPQGLELTFRSDAFWVRMESEAVESAQSGHLAASTGDASRIRLVLEGSREFDLASGGTFAPSAQVGVRHDGGDAEAGSGIEAGAGARFAGEGFVIEGAVRTLVAHEESGYEDWGASASVRIDPGASGRGLALAVAPAWGSTSSGVERLRSLSDAGRVVGDREFDAGRRLDAEVAYGFGLTGARGVVAPYAGLSLADGGGHTYRSGARWRFGPGDDVRLEAVREFGRATDGDDAARRDSLMLRVSMRW